jgi:hypothetical protein
MHWLNVLGIVLLLVAFGHSINTDQSGLSPRPSFAHISTTGAAAGFAIAGGLCFVAASLSKMADRKPLGP